MQTRKETRTKAISPFFLGTQGTRHRLNSLYLEKAKDTARCPLDILTPFRPGLAESHQSSLGTCDGLLQEVLLFLNFTLTHPLHTLCTEQVHLHRLHAQVAGDLNNNQTGYGSYPPGPQPPGSVGLGPGPGPGLG